MSTNEKSLFDIMTDFEYIEFELERVRDLLSIFDERMTKDVKLLNEGWKADHFKRRYEVSKTLLDTLFDQLTSSIESMSANTQAGYRICKDMK